MSIVDCGAVAGWQRLPLPLPDATDKPATLDGLGSQAEAKRDAVAQAVAEAQRGSAAKRPADGGDGDGAKRAAPKTGGMMALPAGLDDDDDDDYDDDE